VINRYVGAAKTWTNGDTDSGKWSPIANGRIVALHLVVYGSAVTALIEGVQAKIQCSSWGGYDVVVGSAGGGIRTAPGVPIPVKSFDEDLAIETGKDVSVQFRNQTADTPVTVEIDLLATLEV